MVNLNKMKRFPIRISAFLLAFIALSILIVNTASAVAYDISNTVEDINGLTWQERANLCLANHPEIEKSFFQSRAEKCLELYHHEKQ